MLPFVLAAAIACLAFFVRGFSGFGSALVMTPLLALVFDPHLAVTSTAILGATIGLGITFQARRHIDWHALRRLVVVAVPSIVVGSLLLSHADEGSLRRALGVVVVFFGARMLAPLRFVRTAERPRWSPRIGYLAGGLGGLLGGAFGTGGPPVVVFLENQIDQRVQLRASILAILMVFDLTRIGSYALTGVFDQESLLVGVAMLPAALLGAVAGARMHVRVNERTFRATLGVFLLASGLLLVLG